MRYFMKKTKIHSLFIFNLLAISVICVLNYFYMKNGFDFTLKCVCSASFAFIGIVNLVCALATKKGEIKFYSSMALGLVFAMLGDIIIDKSFILGAAIFALGHVFFVIAYYFLQKFHVWDLIISGIFFLGSAIFLLFCPLLSFDVPVFKIVCLVYALIISCMLGKALSNFIRKKTLLFGTIAFASALFFFSDLMLVFSWFIGLWDWTNEACMGTYYPALCLLALSMAIRMKSKKET